ncbi:MAG: cell division protein FtsW [Gemmatimonadetes bacterium]|nr:MAG: cell division protein FtsW [Gemmatimonadota bacterium]
MTPRVGRSVSTPRAAPRAPRAAAADLGLGRGWEAGALLAVTVALLVFGLATLFSASAYIAQRAQEPGHYYVVRQAVGATLGLVALAVCAWMPYDIWRRWSWHVAGAVWVLLLVVVLPGTEAIAPVVKGSRRWIRMGVTLQPSELAKVAIVVWTAALAVRKQAEFRSLRRGLGPFLAGWAVLLVPIALEPDLSTTVLVGLLGVVVVYAAGARLGHFVFLGLLTLPLLIGQLQEGFRARRLSAFLDPSADPSGAGFQVQQSLVALGSGGLTGVGFGEGRQKFGFVPEAHNDFIFAMIGEEWGLLGVLVTVTLYGLLVLIGFRIAGRAPDLFGQLLGIGLTSMIALQAVLHMSVGLGLVPPTGLALPLVSYGRSNLLVTLAAIGILISIARTSERVYYGGGRA